MTDDDEEEADELKLKLMRIVSFGVGICTLTPDEIHSLLLHGTKANHEWRSSLCAYYG